MSSSSHLLLVAVLAVFALPLLVSSMSVRTYSDASCSQALPYSYVNSSITTNNTDSCFATGEATISAYEVTCRHNTQSNDSSLAIRVEVTAYTNSSSCGRYNGRYPVIVWDVEYEAVSVVNGTTHYNYYTAEATCVPLLARLGAYATGSNLSAVNQSQVYGIVSCTSVLADTNSAAPSVSAWSTPLAALAASALLYVLQ